MLRALLWAPTIALSWLWGLGFFYSFHITLANGLVGFLGFAIPNTVGLALFGRLLGDPRRDPAAILRKVQARYLSLFLVCQLLAVAITLMTVTVYVAVPLMGWNSLPLGIVAVLLATAIGHKVGLAGLKRLHAAYVLVGVLAALVVLVGLVRLVPPHPLRISALDSRFFGLVLPTLVGFLLGPWADIQHWQRVVAIRENGGSVRAAYAWGALLFLGLISLNAALAVAAGPALVATTADGLAALQGAVAGAVVGTGSGLLAIAFLVWVGVAMVSTLDSFYAATRWLLEAATSRSNSPLLAFVPAGLVTSPLWCLAAALGLAGATIAIHAGMIYLMMPFASLMVGAAACLVLESLGGRNAYDGVLCTMIGAAAYLMLATGYIGDMPAMMDLAPLVALVGALPGLQATSNRGGQPSPVETDGAAIPVVHAAAIDLATDTTAAVLSHGFDGQWFFMHMMPTYDDTNSVGNVYFANYFRWVGKARELLFNSCMPEFDLRTTSFFILTKSFEHDFRREIREFTPVTVRLRISRYNRKFVTLVHEILSKSEGLVGRGEQTLMFVDPVDFRPLDIPPVILKSFMPYFAQALRSHAPRLPEHERAAVI